LEQNSNFVRVHKDNSGNPVVPTGRPFETVTLASPPASPPGAGIPSPVKAIGGADGSDVGEAQFVGSGMQGSKRGLFALEKADLFNLLCLPPFSFTTQNVTTTLVSSAASYCKDRRAMLIVDPPDSWTTKKAAKDQFTDPNVDFVGTRSNYAAIFFPRLKQPNPLRDNQVEEFAPCGAVAGIFARTDAQRGVWKAPAGQDASLVAVPQLSVPLTDDENGELNPLGINCLRAFPVIGRVVWGARTLEGADRLASEWKYIPVRRTALYIEESLYRGTQWVVFEPNDEPLWAQIRLNVGAFMQGLFRQGAFQGKTPREAYLVKCDKETTTQDDINKGIVNILVGFAPLKPAEFVIIKIQQLAGQIEV
jgi:phage tail sheath protein FI